MDSETREGPCFGNWMYAALAHMRKNIRGLSNHAVNIRKHDVSIREEDDFHRRIISHQWINTISQNLFGSRLIRQTTTLCPIISDKNPLPMKEYDLINTDRSTDGFVGGIKARGKSEHKRIPQG